VTPHSSATTSRLGRILPFLRWWPRVDRVTVRADAVAGLIGAIIVLPQGVAFATLAGLPPQYGLYAAMVPAVIAALFGSSWHLVSGPTNVISIFVFSSVSVLAVPGSDDYIRLVLALTFLAGAMQLAMGLARLGTLELKARAVVEGLLSGLHRSPFKGFSVEFAEYRQYLPGDDLAAIDWKVYARTDRHYVKKFEEETNVDCHLLLDVSASMGYGSRGITKLEYGALLASSLAFLMNRQRDAVGLTTFDDAIVTMVPPSARASHLRSILVTLDRTTLGHRTDVSKPLHVLADGISKRGLVVFISDLLDEPDRVVDGLRHFRFRGSEVIVFHLIDPAELTFPFDRAARFRDVELGDEVMAVPSVVRQEYLDALNAAIERYKRELGSEGIDYRLIDTSTPLEFALVSYLSTRGRRR